MNKIHKIPKWLSIPILGILSLFLIAAASKTLIGPTTSTTDNAIVRWNGTDAYRLQNSLVVVDDSGNVTGINNLTLGGILTANGEVEFNNNVIVNGNFTVNSTNATTTVSNIVVNGTLTGDGVNTVSNATWEASKTYADTRVESATNITVLKVNSNNIVGVIPVANLGTGTPDGTKFLKDDGTFATPTAGGAGQVLTAIAPSGGKGVVYNRVYPNGAAVAYVGPNAPAAVSTLTAVLSDGTVPTRVRSTSVASLNAQCGVRTSVAAGSCHASDTFTNLYVFSIPNALDQDAVWVAHSTTSPIAAASDTPTHTAGFRCSTRASDTTWIAYTCGAGSPETRDTGVSVSTGTVITAEVRKTATQMLWLLNGSPVYTNTTAASWPSGAIVAPQVILSTFDAEAETIDIIDITSLVAIP